jgi:phosphoglycerol transferase MdoB-like AlkP superfamily enzyme
MVYGGDANFANYRSFFTYAGFEHITSVEDFPGELDNSKWGVHDQYLFEQASKELDTVSTASPFFKVLLTLSSHEPFDVPLKQFSGEDEASLFINSCMYTDKYLGEFISRCKQQPWWNNTLMVITADHGHRLPHNINPRTKAKFKIPLLLIGGAVKRDTVIHTLGGQTDIANTILGQIDKSYEEFTFSKNLLGNNVKEFAMYIFTDGYGYIEPDKYLIYDNQGKLYLKEEGTISSEDKYFPKAYLQKLYSDYNLKK